MRKWLFILLALLPLTAAAQKHTLESVAAHLGADRISLHYDCTIVQPAPVRLSGDLLVQGDCYLAKGNGMENYCDGESVWTVDRSAKEVYIENAGGDIASNIEKFLGGIRDFKYDGSSLSCRIVKKEQGLDLEFKAQGIKTVPASEDGTVYSFDVSALDSSWVISDLR